MTRAPRSTESGRKAAVLFADVTGSSELYRSAGDGAAAAAITSCIETLGFAARLAGGRVIKTIGDAVMAVFPTPDAAAVAAGRMHVAVEALPALEGTRLGLRIGFHAGPVIQRDDDVYGDTVNLASRLVEQAVKAQTLTSKETAAHLTPALRSAVRPLYPVRIRGKAKAVQLCEVMWRQSADVTDLSASARGPKAARMRLRLKYNGREIMRRRRPQSILLGREHGNDIVLSNAKASRQHCTIEQQHEAFLIKDHSRNGTYVTIEGEPEVFLQREDLTLWGHGWLSFGEPRSSATELIEYFCEPAPSSGSAS